MFGLCNAPATFQNMMNDIFSDLIAQGKIYIYLDDILVHTPSEEGHEEIVLEVLAHLQENDLFVKPEKCEFHVTEVEFLGVIVGSGKIKILPSKLKAIQDWPTPRNLKELQSFLGTANFCQRFILGYSSITKPLHKLTQKDQEWFWDESCEKVFNYLKDAFTSAPILKIADPSMTM